MANQCGNISELGSHPRGMNQPNEAKRLLTTPLLAESQMWLTQNRWSSQGLSVKSQNTPPCLSPLCCFPPISFTSRCAGANKIAAKVLQPIPPLISLSVFHTHTHTHTRPQKHGLRKFKEDVKQPNNFTASQEIVEMLALQVAPHKGTTD